MKTAQKQDRKNLIKNGVVKMQDQKKQAAKDAQQDGYADAKADAYRLENEGKWDEAVIAWGLALDLATTEKDKKAAAGRKGAAKVRASAAAKAIEEQMEAQAESERDSAKKQAAEAIDKPTSSEDASQKPEALTDYTPAIINALAGTPLRNAYVAVIGEEPRAKTPVPALRARIIAELKRLEAADAKDAAEAANEAANEAAVKAIGEGSQVKTEKQDEKQSDETRACTPEEMAAEAKAAKAKDGDADRAEKEGARRMLRDGRLPPAGTVIIKRDRHGAERCRCTILDGGKVEYVGKEYKTISAAGLAAMASLGLEAKTCDGFAFWGLKKKEDVAESKGTKEVKDTAKGLLALARNLLGRFGHPQVSDEEVAALNSRIDALLGTGASAPPSEPQAEPEAQGEPQAEPEAQGEPQ